jgi:uncharacterized protein
VNGQAREAAAGVPRPLADPLFGWAVLAGPAAWIAIGLARGRVAYAGGLAAQATTALVLAVLIYPVLEEWLFRGLVQPALGAALRRRSIPAPLALANLLTSGLFSAAHLFAHPAEWAALSFFPSLVFGFFRDRYQRIGPGIGLHGFYNAGYVLFAAPPG